MTSKFIDVPGGIFTSLNAQLCFVLFAAVAIGCAPDGRRDRGGDDPQAEDEIVEAPPATAVTVPNAAEDEPAFEAPAEKEPEEEAPEVEEPEETVPDEEPEPPAPLVCESGFHGPACDDALPLASQAPGPADGAIGQALSLTLSWAGGDPDGTDVTFEVYLGTEPAGAKKIATVEGTDGGELIVEDLQSRTDYVWRVSTVDAGGGRTDGPWWQLTTGTISPCPDMPLVQDDDGNSYNTILIEGRCWMAESLRVGKMLLNSQKPTNDGVVEKWCPNDSVADCETYGALYTWHEATQGTPKTQPLVSKPQGLCPSGWHVANKSEWEALTAAYDNDELFEGGVSDFAILPGGYRSKYGEFEWSGEIATVWTGTYKTSTAGFAYSFSKKPGANGASSWSMGTGMSVRCIQDNQ